MLLYQHRQISEINDLQVHPHDPSSVDAQCYLEDGSSVWILVEWIDQTEKGELREYLQARFPQHQALDQICPTETYL